jgi:hypothetical protein
LSTAKKDTKLNKANESKDEIRRTNTLKTSRTFMANSKTKPKSKPANQSADDSESVSSAISKMI